MASWKDVIGENVLLRERRMDLVKSLNLGSGNVLIPALISKQHLTNDEAEIIESLPSNLSRVNKLLTILCRRLTTSIFLDFVKMIGDEAICNNSAMMENLIDCYQQKGGNISNLNILSNRSHSPVKSSTITNSLNQPDNEFGNGIKVSEMETGDSCRREKLITSGDIRCVSSSVDCRHRLCSEEKLSIFNEILCVSSSVDCRQRLIILTDDGKLMLLKHGSTRLHVKTIDLKLPTDKLPNIVCGYKNYYFVAWISENKFRVYRDEASPSREEDKVPVHDSKLLFELICSQVGQLACAAVCSIMGKEYVVVAGKKGTVVVYEFSNNDVQPQRQSASYDNVPEVDGMCSLSREDAVHIGMWSSNGNIAVGKVDGCLTVSWRKILTGNIKINDCTLMVTKDNTHLACCYSLPGKTEVIVWDVDNDTEVAKLTGDCHSLFSEPSFQPKLLFNDRNDTLYVVSRTQCTEIIRLDDEFVCHEPVWFNDEDGDLNHFEVVDDGMNVLVVKVYSSNKLSISNVK